MPIMDSRSVIRGILHQILFVVYLKQPHNVITTCGCSLITSVYCINHVIIFVLTIGDLMLLRSISNRSRMMGHVLVNVSQLFWSL